MYYAYHSSPVGPLLLVGDDSALKRLCFPTGAMACQPAPGWIAAEAPFERARQQLDAYFDGHGDAFDLPLAPEGTPFQRAVWACLRDIPYGETRSYKQVAAMLGRQRPEHCGRAIGAANARNPIPVIIPCHRVVGADGGLTGFGGGLEAKRTLLQLEGLNWH